MTFRLVVTPNGVGSEVYLNNQKLEGVTSISVACDLEKGTRVALEFVGQGVIVDGEGPVTQTPVKPAAPAAPAKPNA